MVQTTRPMLQPYPMQCSMTLMAICPLRITVLSYGIITEVSVIYPSI